MGPLYPSRNIATPAKAGDYSKWNTRGHTDSALNSGEALIVTTQVSASGIVEATILYEMYWTNETTYSPFSFNSNYAAKTILYGAGANFPSGLGYTPAFGINPYIPTPLSRQD